MFTAMAVFFSLLYLFFAEQPDEARRTLKQGPARYVLALLTLAEVKGEGTVLY